MLYGSYARGDFGPKSDIDLLVVRRAHARTLNDRGVSLSTYSRRQLESASGTLFGMHLARDGVVLHDTNSWMSELVPTFKSATPAAILDRVRELATLLNSDGISRVRYRDGMIRVARYLLRTALYAIALTPGPPCFSVSGLADRFDEPELATMLSSHRAVHGAPSDAGFRQLEERLQRAIGPFPENPYRTIEALIVAEWDTRKELANAALLALSASRSELPYAQIPRIVL